MDKAKGRERATLKFEQTLELNLRTAAAGGLSCITHRRPANFKYDKQQLVNNLFSLAQINAFRAICLHSFCDIDLTELEEA